MPNLLDYLQEGDAESIERTLCEDELVIICDDQESPVMIVEDFAQTIRGLGCSTPTARDLEITFRDRDIKVELQGDDVDSDRTRWAIRDLLLPDYEIRVLLSCLGTDTLAFLVEPPSVWQEAESRASEQMSELFGPFTDSVGFFVTE